MKVVVMIDNIKKDRKLLNDLFHDDTVVKEDIIYIPSDVVITNEDYNAYAADVFNDISSVLNEKQIQLNSVDLRIVVDLFLKPLDREDVKTINDKTGLMLLQSFVDKYASEFKKLHCFIMSKISTGGPVFDYTAKKLAAIKGGMILLQKPIAKVGFKSDLMVCQYPVYLYTSILEDKYCSTYAHIAFANAVIMGEKK